MLINKKKNQGYVPYTFINSGNKSMKLGDDVVVYNKDFEESNEVIVPAYGNSKNSLMGRN